MWKPKTWALARPVPSFWRDGGVRRGPNRIANGPCGEGLARARGLVADCHYRIADSLRALNRRKEALAEFEAHLDMRGPGCQSIYKLGELQGLNGFGGIRLPRLPRRS